MSDYPFEPHPIDRRGWPSGPWDAEPNLSAWTEPETGYACRAMRNFELGTWCGYVRLPPEHLLFGVAPNERLAVPPGWAEKRARLGDDVGVIDVFIEGAKEDDGRLPLSLLLAAHGGVNWAQDGWIGFDCCHAGDIAPGLSAMTFPDAVYRSLAFVRAETDQLAWQLKELGEALGAAADQHLAGPPP